MSTKRTLNVGLVGCGFMGRTHSNAFAKVNQFFELDARPVLKAACARNPETAEAFARNWGYESFETDWRALVRRPDIDLIDIASPNDTHAEIAIAAAEAGKMVMCEKPLGRNAAETQRMVAAVEAAQRPNMVWYNFRRVPAVTLAKQLIDEGTARPRLPLSRQIPAGLDHFRRSAAGRRGLVAARRERRGQRRHRRFARPLHRYGHVAERADRQVTAMTETFVKERTHTLTGKRQEVTIDDAAAFLARFANGSLATFEATRYARGHKAQYTLEINGENASIAWDLHDLHRLQLFRP